MKHSIFLTKIKKGTFSVPSFIEEVAKGRRCLFSDKQPPFEKYKPRMPD